MDSARLEACLCIVQNKKQVKALWGILLKTKNLHARNFEFTFIHHSLPDIHLCPTTTVSMKLAKGVIVISVLYDTYLLYALYGRPLLPVLLSSFTTSILFYTTFLKNQFVVQCVETTSVAAGFAMILFQRKYPNFDQYISTKLSTLTTLFCKETDIFFDTSDNFTTEI